MWRLWHCSSWCNFLNLISRCLPSDPLLTWESLDVKRRLLVPMAVPDVPPVCDRGMISRNSQLYNQSPSCLFDWRTKDCQACTQDATSGSSQEGKKVEQQGSFFSIVDYFSFTDPVSTNRLRFPVQMTKAFSKSRFSAHLYKTVAHPSKRTPMFKSVVPCSAPGPKCQYHTARVPGNSVSYSTICSRTSLTILKAKVELGRKCMVSCPESPWRDSFSSAEGSSKSTFFKSTSQTGLSLEW